MNMGGRREGATKGEREGWNGVKGEV